MLSFRDIAASTDGADSLQTSLLELQRRRQAKQQRQQRERDTLFTEEDETYTSAQELAYSREVLHTWSRSYPKLRDVIAAFASGSDTFSSKDLTSALKSVRSNAAEWGVGSSIVAATRANGSSSSSSTFSVADTIKRAYPATWVIPAGTIPVSYYTDSAPLDDSLQVCSTAPPPLRHLFASTSTASSQIYQPQTGRLTAVAVAAVGGPHRSSWVTDYSYRRCLVRIQREAVQLPTAAMPSLAPTAASVSATPVTATLVGWTPPTSVSSAFLSAAFPAPQQKQRVLARWPQGKPASTKVSAVLRSIDIEERKREQWNAHVRKQQPRQGDSDEEERSSRTQEKKTNDKSNRELVSQTSLASYSVTSTAVRNSGRNNGSSYQNRNSDAVVSGQHGSLPTLSEDNSGRELYWPAYITNVHAIFTGADCLRDDYQGLGLLQQYERFDVVLALALASPLRLVVDVVYAVDETSEGFHLSIDPVVTFGEGMAATAVGAAADDGDEASDAEDAGREGQSVYRPLLPNVTLRTPKKSFMEGASAEAGDGGGAAATAGETALDEESCPLLLPSTLPAVISDLNYAFQPAPPAANANSAASSATAAEARRRRRSSSSGNTAVSPASSALYHSEEGGTTPATLRRRPLSTAPLSAFAILAGPVSQSRSIVLLRPTSEVVCAARARALQELERRWQRLRQALLDRLVAYEEEPPWPVGAAPDDVPSEAEVEETGAPLVQLPEADSYVSPFIDERIVKGEELPDAPAGAVMLTEEETRRQTHLPELQGRRKEQFSRRVNSDHARSGRTSQPLTQEPPSASYLIREKCLQSTKSVDEAAATRSLSPTASHVHRLPVRRRPSQDPSSNVDVVGVSGVTAPIAHSSRQLQPPYTPRLVAFAQELASRHSLLVSREDGSVSDSAASSSCKTMTRLRDDIFAPTRQPRSAADPQPTHIDVSMPANGVNTSDLSVEESRVLSAAVREAALRQTQLEDALRSQQQKKSAPRSALPSRTVEAPSPALPETSASPSVGRRDKPPQKHKDPPGEVTLDITNNTSAIAASTALASTPPSSMLYEAMGDASPFPWDAVGSSPSRREKLRNRSAHNSPQKGISSASNKRGQRSASSSPGGVGGMGMNDSSSLQITPPLAAHLTPRQRFNQLGQLIIPSLSTTNTTITTADASPESSTAARTTTTATTTTAAAAAIAIAPSPAASFSTPPPPAPPSHSGSPLPRDAVLRSQKQLFQQQQQQQCEVALHTGEPRSRASPRTNMMLTPVKEKEDDDGTSQRGSAVQQLRTPSFPRHPNASSPEDDGDGAAAASSPVCTASTSHGHRSSTQPAMERLTRTHSPHHFTTASKAVAAADLCVGEHKPTSKAAPRTAGSCGASIASSLDSAASNAPQLRKTAAYPSLAAHIQERPHDVSPNAIPNYNAAAPPPRSAPDTDVKETAALQRTTSREHSMSPTAFMRPSFSPASSSTRSSSNSSALRGQQHLELRHMQQQLQWHAGASQPVPRIRGGGALQSPRSLAVSAAAAALAKSKAEMAAAAALGSGSVGGVLGGGRRAEQDSPPPRRPSPAKDAAVPARAKAFLTSVSAIADLHPLLLQREGSDTASSAQHHQQQQQQQQRPASTTDSGAALSSSVNREVELPNPSASCTSHPSKGRETKQGQEEEQRQYIPSLAMPHRTPHTAALQQNLRAHDDDAELVRLYELLHQHQHSSSSVNASAPSATKAERASGEEKTRKKKKDSVKEEKKSKKAAAEFTRTPRSDRAEDEGYDPPQHTPEQKPSSTVSSQVEEKKATAAEPHLPRRFVSRGIGADEVAALSPPSPVSNTCEESVKSAHASSCHAAHEEEKGQRRVVAQLVSLSPSSVSSVFNNSPSSTRNASPAPLDAAFMSISPHSALTSPSVQRHAPQHHAARRSPRPQRAVLVRRVVRRRRSEVFVEEGGSLVYRAPVAVRLPSNPRSSSDTPSRARSATRKVREREQQ